MPIELSPVWIVILNAGGWLAVQLGLAWVFLRMPARWFQTNALFDWEKSGRFYERGCGIKHWKKLLPDGARWFVGGFGKRTLEGVEPAYLQRFVRETRRGELCHGCALLATPIFFLWNPWWGDLIVVIYALSANVPCILTQRHTRARLLRLLARMSGVGDAPGACK